MHIYTQITKKNKKGVAALGQNPDLWIATGTQFPHPLVLPMFPRSKSCEHLLRQRQAILGNTPHKRISRHRENSGRIPRVLTMLTPVSMVSIQYGGVSILYIMSVHSLVWSFVLNSCSTLNN